MKKKTVLITGSTGFIGKNLVESFRNKYDILSPNHYELDLVNSSDVKNYLSVNEVDAIIHCANYGGNRKIQTIPGQTLERNLRMFLNLVTYREPGTRIINLGSGAEYNKSRPLKNIKESEFGTQIPPDEYGLSKYLISQNIRKTFNTYTVRLFGVFGKYEDYEYRFISNAILKNLLHMPITIRQNVEFSWLYVDDLTKILDIFLTTTPRNSAYNVTPSLSTDLVTIARIINSLSDYESEIIVENPGYNFEYTGNNNQLLEYTGVFSFTHIEDAIKEMFHYYTPRMITFNWDAIRNDVYAKKCTILSMEK